MIHLHRPIDYITPLTISNLLIHSNPSLARIFLIISEIIPEIRSELSRHVVRHRGIPPFTMKQRDIIKVHLIQVNVYHAGACSCM